MFHRATYTVLRSNFCIGNGYSFSFNGKENDNEVSGDGNAYDFGARIYSSRLGKWLSIDPAFKKFPYESNYSFVSNSPLIYIDEGGNTKRLIINVYNEATKQNSTIVMVVNDDLVKGNVYETSNHQENYDIGWYDINVVQNVTIKKNETVIVETHEEQGELRFQQHPIKDALGINSDQESVNEEIEETNLGWGGVNWTWENGKSGETRHGRGKIQIDNINLLMSALTSFSPNELNIPAALTKEMASLEVLSVLKGTMERQSQVIDLSYTALDAFAKKIRQWKSENEVKACKTCDQYFESNGNGSNTIPKDKVLSKDSTTGDEH